MSTPHPANVATPATAAWGLVPQVRVAPPGVVSARVTLLVLPVTVFPNTSWTVTTGCVPKAVPPVLPPGWVVNASLAAAPGVIAKLLLRAVVKEVAVAVSV